MAASCLGISRSSCHNSCHMFSTQVQTPDTVEPTAATLLPASRYFIATAERAHAQERHITPASTATTAYQDVHLEPWRQAPEQLCAYAQPNQGCHTAVLYSRGEHHPAQQPKQQQQEMLITCRWLSHRHRSAAANLQCDLWAVGLLLSAQHL